MSASAQNIFDNSLVASGIGVSYRGRKVLEGVTLKFEIGKITALVGPSGCGKTSFLNVLNRMTDFIAGCKVEGKVHLAGVDVKSEKMDARTLRRQVGMIFQRPNPFPLSVRRNMELPIREKGVFDRHEIEYNIKACLQAVGLWSELKDRLEVSALELSGGQKQRLCLARALTMNPDFLLMDEPCSSLDPISCGVIEDLIVDLRKSLGIAIVTHNLPQAKRIADNLAMFWVHEGVGGLIEAGDCRALVSQPIHPMTQAFMNGLKG